MRENFLPAHASITVGHGALKLPLDESSILGLHKYKWHWSNPPIDIIFSEESWIYSSNLSLIIFI